MPPMIERSRNSCAMHGALQTLQAIPGVVPIVHANAGCGAQQWLGGCRAGAVGGLATPSSNVTEKQVVFGGTARLREQIKNAVRLLKADLFAVVSGCATELVGDDIPAMAKESREEGYPVIDIPTPGFRGDVYTGYRLAVKGLCDQLPKLGPPPAARKNLLVNIFGVVPGQSVYWQGDLAEVQRTLEQLGLEVNVLFGPGSSIGQWADIPRAELNVALSPWGADIAESLRERWGTPFLDFGYLPVGPEDTGGLLREVTGALGLDPFRTQEIIVREQQRWSYYLDRIAEAYLDKGFQKDFALVGETGQGVGLLRFLTNTLGLIPKLWVVTDNPGDERKSFIAGEVEQLDHGLRPELVFCEDAGTIRSLLVDCCPEVIFGSSLETRAAEELAVPLVRVSFPVADRVILGKSYAGYRGAVTFLEDLGSEIVSARRGARRVLF